MKNPLYQVIRVLQGHYFAKKRVLLLMLLCYSSIGVSQIDILKYYSPNYPILNTYDFLKVDFNWNMNGPLQALINEGINSLDDGNPANALANLDQAINLDSTLWVSHYYRGICHRLLFQLDEAEQDFLTAQSLNPKLAEVNIELAKVYVPQGMRSKASNQLDEAIRKNPLLADGYFYRGILEFTIGNSIKATKLFEKVNELNPTYANAYMMRGLIEWMIKKDDKDAILMFNKAIESDSTFIQGYFWRGLVNVKNKPQECLTDWDKAVQLAPQNPFYTLMRGYLYIELNQFDNAFIDLKNAFKAQAINEDKFTGSQTIIDQRIDQKAAINYLIANGYGLDEEVFSLLKKSVCLLLARNNGDALKSVNLAEEKQVSATVYFLKAIILENNYLHNKAFEYYTLALTLDNDIYDAHRKKCVYHFELNDYKSAHLELKEMFRLQPASPVGHRLRGLIRFAQGYYGPAIADLNQFIKTDTTDTEVMRVRSTCFVMLGKSEEAKKDMHWLTTRNPTNWSILEEVITNHLVLKDTMGAINLLQTFIETHPVNYSPYLKIAEIYVSQKRWYEAEVEVNKLSAMIKSPFFFREQSLIFFWKGLIAIHYHDSPFRAIDNFDLSIKNDPSNLEAKYQRAKVYQSVGQQKKALNSFRELKNMGFKDSDELYNLLIQKDSEN